MDRLSYPRVYADSEGESHLEDREVELTAMDYAPPAPAMWASAFAGATGYHFLSAPVGWVGDWHPVPRRQVFLILRGEICAEFGDGTRRAFRPGDLVLLEDTRGRGHRSWVVGDEDVLMAVLVSAQLDAETPGAARPAEGLEPAAGR